MTGRRNVRIAALGDIHVTKTSQGALQPLLAPLNDAADVLLLCGDLTDYGLREETSVLVKELQVLRIPVVAVLGNHDYESGRPEDVRGPLCDAGVRVLDGEACELLGIGFAGVKGFCGGFGRATLGAWGERAIKSFVQESLDEALKLESALARLRTPRRVAVLHYAPVAATVEGEPPEIFPFLGTSRLEGPLNRHPVDVVFHGHAHRGCPEGRTVGGTPVYNVALPLLRRMPPERGAGPVRIVELEVDAPGTAAA
jgi:Icc-related predicted phosphoesterase